MSNNTLFIQFYSNSQSYGFNSNIYNGSEYISMDNKNLEANTVLSNGFSSIHNLCKNKGDFYWFRYEMSDDINKVIDDSHKIELPIKKGTVYVSAFYNGHLYLTYLWSLKYPKINFIVGGPAADPHKIIKEIPQNLTITKKHVTNLFEGNPKWGIDFPENMHSEVFLGFPIDRNCYWGKCAFCNYNEKFDPIDINYNFIDSLPVKRKYSIFLYTPSISPYFLKNNFSKFKSRKDIEYSFFVRGSKEIVPALAIAYDKCAETGFDFTKLSQVVGVEFPSNRMLKKLNKGTTTAEILKTIKLMYSKRTRIYCQILLGFNDLTECDVAEAKSFFTKLYDITEGRAKIKIHNLVCKIDTPIYSEYEKRKEFNLGPFHFGFIPKLTTEQIKLNNQVRDIIYDTKFYQINDIYTKESVKNYEFC